MKVLVSLLVAMSFFLHMRSIGINITPFGIFVTLSVGVYFIAEQLLRMRIIPMMAFAYLSIFFVIGLLNQNNLYYTVYDFARMLSAAGFFFYSFYYFKERGYIHFIDSLVYFSKIIIYLNCLF